MSGSMLKMLSGISDQDDWVMSTQRGGKKRLILDHDIVELNNGDKYLTTIVDDEE